MRRWPTLVELRGAAWANRALRDVRSELVAGRLTVIALRPPPDRSGRGARGVKAILRLRSHSCLESAIVRQTWLAAQEIHRDVVIGVSSPSRGFVAHAWLEGDDDVAASHFCELTRLSR